ncbi:MAG TPA: discoidin domain-containing protein, partial [Pseudomonadota bacterium]|nr:discoidin domain-containing protein [Pseudomonadota bacterium]
VRLVAKSEVSGGAATAVEDFQLLLDGQPLDRSEWAVSVDSQESASENGAARNAIDGQAGTAWVTEWSRRAPKPPHWLSIDLQSPQVFNGFAYQPRASNASGRIAGYELQVSTNAQTWTTIASGTFANTGTLQTVACKLPRGL